MENQEKIPFSLCSHNETLIKSNAAIAELVVGQSVNLQPLIEIDIAGNTFYYGLKKYMLIKEVDDTQNGKINGVYQQMDKFSFNNGTPVLLPEVHLSHNEKSAVYQLIIKTPISVRATFLTQVITKSEVDVNLISHTGRPIIFSNNFKNNNGNALLKLAMEKKKEYIEALSAIKNQIEARYDLSIDKINKTIELQNNGNGKDSIAE